MNKLESISKSSHVELRKGTHKGREVIWFVFSGTQMPSIRELPGHADIKTTMLYTHITTASMEKVVSPLDRLLGNAKIKIGQKPQLE